MGALLHLRANRQLVMVVGRNVYGRFAAWPFGNVCRWMAAGPPTRRLRPRDPVPSLRVNLDLLSLFYGHTKRPKAPFIVVFVGKFDTYLIIPFFKPAGYVLNREAIVMIAFNNFMSVNPQPGPVVKTEGQAICSCSGRFYIADCIA